MPEAIAPRSENKPFAVGAEIGLIGRRLWMARPEPFRQHAAAPVFAGLQIGERQHAGIRGDVDAARLTRPLGPAKRGDAGQRRIYAGAVIGERNATFYGRAVILPRHAHDAAHALNGDIERAAIARGAGLAAPRAGAINAPRVQLDEVVITEATAFEDAGPEILELDIGLAAERPRLLKPFWVFEVDTDTAFVAIEDREIHAEAEICLARPDQRRPVPHRLPLRGFHLDN